MDSRTAQVAISAAVQRMVRSDLGASGVMFTLDTESGFRDVVFITSSWGLGEMVVQGAVNPDEFYVHKPMLELGKPAILRRRLGSKLQKMVFSDRASAGRSVRTEEVPPAERDRFSLSDADVLELARTACLIEKHYGPPDGHRMGQGRRGWQHPRAAGAAGDGALPQVVRAARNATGSRARAGCWPAAAPSGRRSAPARCAS